MKKKNTKTSIQNETTETIVTVAQTHHDMVLSLLIVSLVINLFILVGWVTLQVTTAYDSQVASFLFIR